MELKHILFLVLVLEKNTFEWFENECMTLIYVIKRTYIIKFEEFLNFTQKVMIFILNHLNIALRFYLNRANAKIKPKP